MNPTARRLVLVLAVLAHLGAGFFYLAAGLVAPLWAVLLLWALWVFLLWVLVRLWRTQPPMALLVPPLALGAFFVALTAGEISSAGPPDQATGRPTTRCC